MSLRRPLAATALLLALAAPPALADGLLDYVKRADPSFSWKATEARDWPGGRATYFEFTSQTWRGIPWTHQLQVYTPERVEHPGHVLLYITSGTSQSGPPGAVEAAQYLALARACGARVAVLPQVPNQPLLGDKVEDELIAETFLRFLKTGEGDWPLLLPMVKSAVRAMDAVQAWAEGEGQPAEKFVVTGASKRGWTTWLTAATEDPRVAAIAPMVIPTLNMRAQTRHQRESFGGKYSEQIADYSESGLTEIFDKPEGEALWKLIDPYHYLDRIKLPVLQLNGTNDPYWTVDSMNLFWDDIRAPKSVVYVPNAGHGLHKSESAVPYVVNTLGAFFRHAAKGEPMPETSWSYKEDDKGLALSLSFREGGADRLRRVRLWTAESATRDFRKAPWKDSDFPGMGGGTGTRVGMTGSVERPEKGFKAVFADLTYEYDGPEYHLSSQIHVLGPNPAGD